MVEGHNRQRGQVIGRTIAEQDIELHDCSPILPAPGSYVQVRVTQSVSEQPGWRGGTL